MAQTVVPWGHSLAVKQWSPLLLKEQLTRSYWQKFVGREDTAVIQQKNELEKAEGDRVQFDLSVLLRGEATIGDDRVEGKEENLRFYSDEVIIDQVRKGVSMGGRMTRKRVIHNFRTTARDRLSQYFTAWVDNLIFMTMSGSRGINGDFDGFPLNYTGHAGNTFRAPDSAHLLYGGSATAKNNLTSGDIMTRALIERLSTTVQMLRALDPENANMLPTTVAGGEHYILLMATLQKHSLRTDAGTNNWLDIQKALVTAEGNKSAIFKGGLGMIDDIVLHSHKSVIRFSDYGVGANLPAARALFMGRQAGVMSYGTPSGQRFSWVEDTKDAGNEAVVYAGNIVGVQKTRFNSRDFGVISVDTYAVQP
jgi:N4-gp56 family major capsid protein